MPTTLPCVYCGMVFSEGTLPFNETQILTDHFKVCEKHPMRQAEAKITKLRDALIGLVGAATKEELTAMELFLRSGSAPSADIIAAINAIHVLLETMDE